MNRWPKQLKYHHLSFTIPEELRNFFKRHREALNELIRAANQTLFYFFKTKKLTPGTLSVIHTFGAKTNWNPHVHIMVTSGGMTKYNIYKSIDFMPYQMILPSRKKGVLRNLGAWCKKNLEGNSLANELRLINSLWAQKDEEGEEKSWYINFSKKANNFEVVLSYIGRYLKRPILAQSRILAYNGENVIFSYKDKYDNIIKTMNVTAMEFIGYLIQHIPNKFFKMIHCAGIFSNRSKKKYLKIINTYYNNAPKIPKIAKNFRERIFMFTGKDPLKCHCGGYFHKYQTIIPGYKPKYFNSS